MKTTLILSCLIAACVTSAQLATNVTITNLSGRVYANLTLDHTNKLGIIWIKTDGNTGILKYKDLSADVLAQYGISTSTVQVAIASEQKAKALWDAKAKAGVAQMQQTAALVASNTQAQALGMELMASLIKNFPEKVSNQRGYMDVEFFELNPPDADQFLSSQERASVEIGMTVWDKNRDLFSDCIVSKNLPNGSDYRPNPLAAFTTTLKRGDKIRLVGKVLGNGPEFDVDEIKLVGAK